MYRVQSAPVAHWAEIRSLQKLLAPRPKKKILHEIGFFLNEPVLAGVAMSELSNGFKKHTLKSRETIPLKQFLPVNIDISDFSEKNLISKILLNVTHTSD
jgi:hypothetical protein